MVKILGIDPAVGLDGADNNVITGTIEQLVKWARQKSVFPATFGLACCAIEMISMGVCASSGGMFNNYAIVQGVDQVVPVDVYAPGCPPGPETLQHAIITLYQLIQSGELTRRRGQAGGGAGVEVDQLDGQTLGG